MQGLSVFHVFQQHRCLVILFITHTFLPCIELFREGIIANFFRNCCRNLQHFTNCCQLAEAICCMLPNDSFLTTSKWWPGFVMIVPHCS